MTEMGLLTKIGHDDGGMGGLDFGLAFTNDNWASMPLFLTCISFSQLLGGDALNSKSQETCYVLVASYESMFKYGDLKTFLLEIQQKHLNKKRILQL